MRRKHHRRYQGRVTRLARLARSLTAPAAAALLRALATLLVITPVQGNAQSATYSVTFRGTWTTPVTAVQERVDDDAETIRITASHEAGTIGAEQRITIIDDDATPAVTVCSGGMAGTYPCSNVDLMSFLALADIGGGSANDIWGWTDSSTGKEYVIMGRSNGTSFVDISDPVNPIYLGNLPPHSAISTSRDIKVYADHAFIVTAANNSGMQVFNLTQLRAVASPPQLLTAGAGSRAC